MSTNSSCRHRSSSQRRRRRRRCFPFLLLRFSILVVLVGGAGIMVMIRTRTSLDAAMTSMMSSNNNAYLKHILSLPATATATTTAATTTTTSDRYHHNNTTTTTTWTTNSTSTNTNNNSLSLVDESLWSSSSSSSSSVSSHSSSSHSSSSCHRICPNNHHHHHHNHHKNIIFLTFPTMAGLLDRLWLMQFMLQIAGYLCAELYVPSPAMTLHHTTHNQDFPPVSCHMTWSDLTTFDAVDHDNKDEDDAMDIAGNTDILTMERMNGTNNNNRNHILRRRRHRRPSWMYHWWNTTSSNSSSNNPESSSSSSSSSSSTCIPSPTFGELQQQYPHHLFVRTRLKYQTEVFQQFEQLEAFSFSQPNDDDDNTNNNPVANNVNGTTHLIPNPETTTTTTTTTTKRRGFIWHIQSPLYRWEEVFLYEFHKRLRLLQELRLLQTLVVRVPQGSSNNNTNNNNNDNNDTLYQQQQQQLQQLEALQEQYPFVQWDDISTPTITTDHPSDQHVIQTKETSTTTTTKKKTPVSSWLAMQPFLIQPFIRPTFPYYDMHNLSSKHDPTLCLYAKLDAPSHVLQLSADIQSQLLQHYYNNTNNNNNTATSTQVTTATVTSSTRSTTLPLIGYFHIRRTDSAKECNSKLDTIQSYWKCSWSTLSNMGQNGKDEDDGGDDKSLRAPSSSSSSPPPVLLLLSSDERNVAYRARALRLLRSVHAPSITVVDLDQVVHETLQTGIAQGTIPEWRNNNFYTFRIIMALRDDDSFIDFKLARRRNLCVACTNVSRLIDKQRAKRRLLKPGASTAWKWFEAPMKDTANDDER